MRAEKRSGELFDLMKGGKFLLANSSRAVAVITAVVACLVTFTDVALSGFGAEDFTSSLSVMLIASYLIFFSCFDSGQTAGMETEEFTAANAEYSEWRSKILPSHIPSLREFCHGYVTDELAYRRLCYITERGESEEELKQFAAGKKLPIRSARVFRRAMRLKSARLTPAILLSGSRASRGGELSSPTAARFVSTLVGLIPTTLGSIFTVSVMLTAKEGLTAEAVIEGILKLSALPMIALKGYRAGYLHARDTLSSWCRLRTRLLRAFLEACTF